MLTRERILGLFAELCHDDVEPDWLNLGQDVGAAGPGPDVRPGDACGLRAAGLFAQPGVQRLLAAADVVDPVAVPEDLRPEVGHARENRRGRLAASSSVGASSGTSSELISASNCSAGISVVSARARDDVGLAYRG